MSIWFALFLGAVQGLTEFLPVSSSGHLAIFQIFFGMEDVNYVLFDVLLHLATLTAVCIFFRRDIADMCVGLVGVFKKDRAPKQKHAVRLFSMIVVATVPLLLFVAFNDRIESLSKQPVVIGAALLFTALLLFLSGKMPRGEKTEKNAKLTDALVVGFSQGIALIPGLSRSGTTITAGTFTGFDRAFAVRFSFLMSIPAILGATVLEARHIFDESFDAGVLPVYGAGMIVAGVVGYLALTWLKKLAQKGFGGFAVYCAIVGAGVIIASFALGK